MDAVSTRAIAGAGTPEACWRAWLSHYPPARGAVEDLVLARHRLHILAPHPDDEVLGCAGIMRQALRLGRPVHVWAITDGEASHAGSRAIRASELAQVRTRESERALRRLGTGIRRHRLNFPDGGVGRHIPEIAGMLAPHVQPGDTIISPWSLDGHPDHEAAACAGRQAARAHGCRLFEVVIWGWHWADPQRGEFPIQRAVAIALTAADCLAKARAIQAFRSQLEPDPATGNPPILPDFVLARFQRPFEVVLR
ncbi:MAG TPA: PIG-L family deacetylase [Bordetella sp.]